VSSYVSLYVFREFWESLLKSLYLNTFRYSESKSYRSLHSRWFTKMYFMLAGGRTCLVGEGVILVGDQQDGGKNVKFPHR
jgi:hypothetical protein